MAHLVRPALGAKLDAVSFDRLVTRSDPFGGSAAPSFDLSGIQLITPTALVGLASACYALAALKLSPKIIVDDIEVRNYLLRSCFVSVVGEVATFEPEFPEIAEIYDLYRGSSPLLIELTKLETERALPSLLSRIVTVLVQRLKYPRYDAYDVATAVSEICQNVFDHNSGTCGFLAMQVYGRGNFLEIAVGDQGAGLRTTLSRHPTNPQFAGDLDAIQSATRLGVSEYADATRGTGLYHLLKIAYKYQGAVQIRSGRAKARYRMDKQQGWGFAVTATPGVHVALTLGSKVAA